jgi:hypothetical protein
VSKTAQQAKARAAIAFGYSLRKLQEAAERGVANADVGAGVEYGALTQRMDILTMLTDAPDLPTAVERLALDLLKFSRQVME